MELCGTAAPTEAAVHRANILQPASVDRFRSADAGAHIHLSAHRGGGRRRAGKCDGDGDGDDNGDGGGGLHKLTLPATYLTQ